VQAQIDSSRWPQLAVFKWLKKQGNIDDAEMHRTFNCGIGMVLVVSPADAPRTVNTLAAHGVQAFEIGAIVPRPPGTPQTVVT
jgi:phosphoribosylformylglycinamidine cyclo-ligase